MEVYVGIGSTQSEELRLVMQYRRRQHLTPACPHTGGVRPSTRESGREEERAWAFGKLSSCSGELVEDLQWLVRADRLLAGTA